MLTATVWMGGEALGNSIEVAGLRYRINHQRLHECSACGGRGHWEDRCEIMMINERKREIIEEMVALIRNDRKQIWWLITVR